MEMEKQKALISIGIMFTTVVWVITGALMLLSFPYLKVELVSVFAFTCTFWVIFLTLYAERIKRENRFKKR